MHMLADSWVQLESEIREFLEAIYRATTAISTMAIGKSSLIQLCGLYAHPPSQTVGTSSAAFGIRLNRLMTLGLHLKEQ